MSPYSSEEMDSGFDEALRNLDLDRLRIILDRQPKLARIHDPEFLLTPLMKAIGASSRLGEEQGIAAIELLLRHGADINAMDFQSDAAIHKAAELGQKKLVALLLARGADVNAKGCSPALHRAAANGHIEIMELLLAHGANVHARNDRGETALDHATKHNKLEAAQILINHGSKSKTRSHSLAPDKTVDGNPREIGKFWKSLRSYLFPFRSKKYRHQNQKS